MIGKVTVTTVDAPLVYEVTQKWKGQPQGKLLCYLVMPPSVAERLQQLNADKTFLIFDETLSPQK